MVTRCSAIIPDLKVAFFRCYSCSHGLEVSSWCYYFVVVCFKICRFGSMEDYLLDANVEFLPNMLQIHL